MGSQEVIKKAQTYPYITIYKIISYGKFLIKYADLLIFLKETDCLRTLPQ
jgi:hypothetical protein